SLLGRAALGHEQSALQLRFLEPMAIAGDSDVRGYAQWASRALFEVGSEALERGRTLVALSALDKLETVAARHSPVTGALARDVVGLLAHFWARGETGRDYVRQFLDSARDSELFADPLAAIIADARAACVHSARFTTGNYLARMGGELTAGEAG
ncbi:MAG: hypothetical protein AAGC55_26100, partial [Myxococcota bacterium]